MHPRHNPDNTNIGAVMASIDAPADTMSTACTAKQVTATMPGACAARLRGDTPARCAIDVDIEVDMVFPFP